MLRENAGVSLLPFFSVRRDIEKGRLDALDAEDFHMQVWRQIVYHKDKWITGEMRNFKAGGGKASLTRKNRRSVKRPGNSLRDALKTPVLLYYGLLPRYGRKRNAP